MTSKIFITDELKPIIALVGLMRPSSSHSISFKTMTDNIKKGGGKK